jgi:hypothetical protein
MTMCANQASGNEGARLPGVFVIGRQHSGNTVMTTLIGRMRGCFMIDDEGVFFEHRGPLRAMASAVERAAWVGANLRIREAELAKRVEEELLAWAGEHREANEIEVYRQAMAIAARLTSNRFWVQKATSYITMGEEIIESMPESKMVYMMRNPYDLFASVRRRLSSRGVLVGVGVTWNIGVRIAQRLHQEHPDRMHIIRYETLVSEPELIVRKLCEFLGEAYDASLLDVEHVNPSENRYQVVEGRRGFNKSRLYYYANNLSKAEIAAMDSLADQKLIRTHYPDLPHLGQAAGAWVRLKAWWLIVCSCVQYPLIVIVRSRRSGLNVRQYLSRRVKSLLTNHQMR